MNGLSTNIPTAPGLYPVWDIGKTDELARVLRVEKRGDGQLAVACDNFWIPLTRGYHWGAQIPEPKLIK